MTQLFHPVQEPRLAELERRITALELELAALQRSKTQEPKRRGRKPKFELAEADVLADIQSP